MYISPIVIVLIIASVAGLWKIFEKAGEKGWKAIVPVYNFYVWLKILKKPWWWMLIYLIPGVGFMLTMVTTGITTLHIQKKKSADMFAVFVALVIEAVVLFFLLQAIKTGMLVLLAAVVIGYLEYCTFQVFTKLLSNKKLTQGGDETIRMIVYGVFFFIALPYYGFSKLAWEAPADDKTKKPARSAGKEWTEAIAFAIVAATIIRTFFIEAYTIPTSSMEKSLMIGDYLFVSKADYGARIPMTPISFPFAHNALPGTKNTLSYLTWMEYPYMRLPGFTHIKRHDVVVFNFPEGDTVPTNIDNPSYYALCRMLGRNYVLSNQPIGSLGIPGPLIIRPIDKEENYIKRCIGTPGDTLLIKHAQVYINGKADPTPSEAQLKYAVTFSSKPDLYNIKQVPNGEQCDVACNRVTVIDSKLLDRLDITEPMEVIGENGQPTELGQPGEPTKLNTLLFTLPKENVEKFRHLPNVVSVTPFIQDSGKYDSSIFPFTPDYKWNVDNFGPLYIPKEGATVKLDTANLHKYRRLIEVYEHNKLVVDGARIYINGKEANSYTFKMNYYFMMGDNRHNSEDSRYWGFVPEDHVVGKASFIWMSLKENVPFLKKFRVKRFFTFIGSEGLSPSYFLPGILVIVLSILFFYIRGMRRAKD